MPTPPPLVTIRATAWRQGHAVLAREGLLAAVAAQVPEATRALLPPHGDAPDAWVDVAHFDAVTDALQALGGPTLVRRLARLGGRELQVAPVRGAVSVLRRLGVGAHAVLKRVETITALQSRGASARYVALDDHAAEVWVAYDDRPPASRLDGVAGRLESLLDLAGLSGAVAWEADAAQATPRFTLTWR